MALDLTIWHNPRCSKSRATLALLTERGLDPQVRLYLKDAPQRDEIKAVLDMAGLAPAGLIRKGEKTFAELSLSLDDPPDRLVDAMAAHPILIERPVVIAGNRAAIGRPPEAVLAILP